MKKTFLIFFVLTSLLTACAGTSALDNTTWELVAYGTVDAPMPALPDVETTITFDGNGNLNGNVGCNSFFGTYKVSGDILELGPIGATEMYCEDTWEQEMGIFQILSGKLSFEEDGDMLMLISEDGTQIVRLKRVQ